MNFLLACSWWSLVLAAIPSLTVAATTTDQEPAATVATLTLSELQALSKPHVLHQALTTTGLIAIVNDDDDDDDNHHKDLLRNPSPSSQQALQAWCDCAAEYTTTPSRTTSSSSLQSITLQDGVTTRTTLATATVGTDGPLALDTTVCDVATTTVLEDLRDQVDVVSQAFVQALDDVLGGTKSLPRPLLHDSYGKAYPTVSSIVQAGTHLEHYHVYETQSTTTTTTRMSHNWTLDFHTDAGLFLVFVPAYNCHAEKTTEADASFWIRSSGTDATPHVISFPRQTRAVIMLGAGAQEWLQHDMALQATVHAVHMQPGQRRAWYGKMHLVPDHAIVQTVPTTKTFRELKQSVTMTSIALAHQQHDVQTVQRLQSPALGCGSMPVLPSNQEKDLSQSTSLASSPQRRRRRLQHVGSPEECNNVTNFFCWYQCLDIPNAASVEGYVNEGYSLYCLDPAVLASSGNQVSKATEPCEEGYVHNGACQGSWQPTAPGVPTTVNFDYLLTGNGTADIETQYCYGGVSMYMDGFHWVHESLCVIYLFPGWVLSSPAKLAWASIGTIIGGMLLEGIIWQRRRVAQQMPAGLTRLGVGSFMYGIQLTVGYLIMLIIMTYSGVLFVCVVGGLMLGNIVFNPKDGLLVHMQKRGQSSAAPGTRGYAVTGANSNDDLPHICPCADDKTTGIVLGSAVGSSSGDAENMNNTIMDERGVDDDDAIPSCCQQKSQNQGNLMEQDVPDGATPCCQFSA